MDRKPLVPSLNGLRSPGPHSCNTGPSGPASPPTSEPLIFSTGLHHRGAAWRARTVTCGRVCGKPGISSCLRVVVSSWREAPAAGGGRGSEDGVTANSARTALPLLFFAPMTRTLVAVVVTTLLGGACARSPRPVAPGPRGSIPMHTLVPRPVHIRARSGRRLSDHADHHDPCDRRQRRDAARRPVSRRLDRHRGRSGAAARRRRRIAAGRATSSSCSSVASPAPADEAYELTVGADRVVITAHARRPACSTACRRCGSCCRAFVEHEATRAEAVAAAARPRPPASPTARASRGAARCSTSPATSSASTTSSATWI